MVQQSCFAETFVFQKLAAKRTENLKILPKNPESGSFPSRKLDVMDDIP